MKKNKLVYYREGDVDRRFNNGITLFAVITLIALFGLFIALNNYTNIKADLVFREKTISVYSDRITELSTELKDCQLREYNNCSDYVCPKASYTISVEKVR
jgi:YbbR domain-containing protein